MTAPGDEAIAAETSVAEEDGQWVVYVETVFVSRGSDVEFTSVKHRIRAYATRRKAEIAARWIQAASNRDLPGPPTGF
jgi:hypothetical protein